MLDCQGFTFRTMGSIGKRDRRVVHHSREGSYNFSTTQSRPNRVLEKYPEARNEYNARRDFDCTRNGRILIGNNVDSGLGESTPQDFSSCCSSSADSTKHIRVTQRQLEAERRYRLSNQEPYPPGDITLDAVLQPIMSTLTRRPRNRPK